MIFSEQAIKNRRARLVKNIDPLLKSTQALLFQSGAPITQPGGLDQTYEFLPDPNFYWLTGSRRSGETLFYSKDLGWVDFYRPLALGETLWEGLREADVSVRGQSVESLDSFLAGQKGIEILSAQAGEKTSDSHHLLLLEGINQARRIKDNEELSLIRKAAQFAAIGYAHLAQIPSSDLTEVDFKVEYEGTVLKAGSQGFPYETLVGSGENSSVLHASPSLKKIKDGDGILIDGGARVSDYCVDITRMFWASGSPSSQQRDLYNLVLRAQAAAIAICKPGAEWHGVHYQAAKVIAEGLLSFGVLKGSVDEILESGAVSCFFPHGVGHMVGQRVRDVGSDLTRPLRKVCGVHVRVDLPLEEGFVMTVEPGIYFSKDLIEHHQRSGLFDDFVNWSEAQKWIPLGGVRIEDDVLITTRAPEVLTESIAKSLGT